jgi:hypothetical protein
MFLLAQQRTGPTLADDYTGWYVGLGVGFTVVIVVVIIVAIILLQAARIGRQAREGIQLMDETREATLTVWGLQEINGSLTSVWRSAESARKILTEGTR